MKSCDKRALGGRRHWRPRMWATGLCVILPLAGFGQEGGSDSDDDSRTRLIRKSRGESDDVMSRVIDYMDQAGRRLSETFDAGSDTRKIQRQIIKELDLAIRQAKQNMRASRSSSQQKGDRRQEGKTSDEADADAAQGNSDAADSASAWPGGRDSEIAKNGALRETRRTWGHLPPRDRDAILQSVDEEIHDKYRQQIERYYETLSDPEFDQ